MGGSHGCLRVQGSVSAAGSGDPYVGVTIGTASLAAALTAANLSSIPVSTPLPFSIVLEPFPPSQAYFNQSLAKSFLLPLLSHLANTSAPLMLNLYPYYSLMQSSGVVPVDNAMFKPLPPSLEMVDPNTLLHYTNVFDAMLDAVYVALKNLNVSAGIPVLVTETGWPSYGDRKQEPVYIYELFNEDLRPGPASEANWGLFHGNGTPPGEGCYEPNDVRSHASFAFNTYYQSQGKAGGSCYFQGAGMVTTTDPMPSQPPSLSDPLGQIHSSP
ncbi:Glucan endo-1,3-beta-glucosidase 1 [Triticum urartu]|uniref:Glucan endo-1,3-beta-glucosidase 1 n=1 Tax=Triticum urartu TaxID=4572 RepID=M7Z7A8_TRIUA|nr:Glucan endo-1,3-beta-glucosidase 1 [Triticum urartu]